MSDPTNAVLICGESGSGKSASLRNIRGQEGVIYFNCEAGKPLPFKNKFKNITIDDPKDIFDYLQQLIDSTSKKFHTIIIDTASFMMERFEAVHVLGSANTMAAWGNYAQFFKELMYDYVAKLSQNVVILAHLDNVLDEDTGKRTFTVPVKGSLKKNGLEAYFTTLVNARKVPIRDIEKEADEGELLTITDRDRSLGYKHVFQTRTVKQTVGDRIRSPFGLFEDRETYIDNDAQILVDRLVKYYED